MRSSNINKNQAGFTLIELVIVIIILGLLAAVAIPKFIDLRKEARIATVYAARGAVSTAMTLVNARSVLDGTNGLASSTVTLDGGVSIRIIYGYPAIVASDANYETDFLTAAGLGDPFRTGTNNSQAYVAPYFDNTITTNCSFYYTNATATSAATLGTVQTTKC